MTLIWPWVKSVHCDLGDMTLGQGHDIKHPLVTGKIMDSIITIHDAPKMLDRNSGYIRTITLTL